MNSITKMGFVAKFAAIAVFGVAFFTLPVAAHAQFAEDGGCCGGFDYTFNDGYDASYNPGFDYTYNPGYDSTYTPGYDSTYTPGYDSYYTPGYDSTYTPGYDSTYSPGYDSFYSESPVFYGSDGAMYSTTGGGYYPTGGGYSTGGGYTTGGSYPQVSFGSYTIGRPTGTTPSTPSTQHQNQHQNQQQSQSSTNNNTNVNNNTSSSNSVSSVSNSGNSNNVNNVNVVVNVPSQQAPVTPVYTLPTVQYPVQFVQTTPVYQPAPYCTISIVNTNGYNNNYGYNQATITWSASNATSAYISPNVGAVTTYGSRVITATGNQVFTMTVYGQNGQTANCQTTFYAPTYVPPVQTPYVSLSQIPYTGFDLGPVGDAAYWAAMIAFALAAGYLVIYFRGGALALAGNVFSSKGHVAEVAEVKVAPAAFVKETPATVHVSAPVASGKHVTTDVMSVTKDGRLVINRS